MNILFLVFLCCAVIQLGYYAFFFSRFALKKVDSQLNSDDFQPLSVIICGKNEADNYREFLGQILEQDYPAFEVLVVDDHSTDDTQEVLNSLKSQFSHLTTILPSVVPDKPGKKAALITGIEHARFDNIVVTDADCRPASKDWLKYMSVGLNNVNTLALGIGPLDKTKGWLNMLIRYETYSTALQYISYALAGLPYMGVGRNMAYKKSTFLSTKEALLSDGIASGDDDLLVNKAAEGDKTSVVLHPDSFMYSPAMPTWKKWMRQKSRHYTAGGFYKPIHKVLLSIYNITLVLYNLLIIPALHPDFVMLTIPIVAGTVFMKNLVHINVTKKLGHQDIMLEMHILEYVWSWVMPYMGLKSMLMKKDKWS